MPMPQTEVFDPHCRSTIGCLCCGSFQLDLETQIVSGFLAAQAWDGPPQLTRLARCSDCGFRFFERGIDDIEAVRYYKNYWDENYIRTRWRLEPFYTRAQHTAHIEWSRSAIRIEALRTVLAASKAPHHLRSALDHDGNEGHMLTGVNADIKAVFDPSGCPPLPGITAYADPAELPRNWELILSCQVLEHVSSPAHYLRSLAYLLVDGGLLYVEVPSENWHPTSGPESLRRTCLQWLLKYRYLLIAADAVCTISRIKFERLPPLGFVAMREHLNYLNHASLVLILERNGFTMESSGFIHAGQLFAIARKSN